MAGIRTRVFWVDLFERAVSTAAETTLGLLVVTTPFNRVGWEQIGWVVATATLASVLKSLAASRTGDRSASLADLQSRNTGG